MITNLIDTQNVYTEIYVDDPSSIRTCAHTLSGTCRSLSGPKSAHCEL